MNDNTQDTDRPAPLPPKIPCTGRTDIEYAFGGIGHDRERTARAIAEGYATGFRQLPPKPKRKRKG